MVKIWINFELGLVLTTSVMISALTLGLSVPLVHGRPLDKTANISRINSTGRKFRMHIKHRYLQLLDHGVVNATEDDSGIYTILQRISVASGQVKIMGIATNTFLCMDECGFLYASYDFADDCVFNEIMDNDLFNKYTSIKYSNANHTMYLAITNKGHSKKMQVKTGSTLGARTSNVDVLIQNVDDSEMDDLEKELQSVHAVRHHHHKKIKSSAKCIRQSQENQRKEKKKY